MKKLIKISGDIKFLTAIIFMAEAVIFSLAKLLMGETTMTFAMLWQLLAVAIGLGILQYVFYGDNLIALKDIKTRTALHFSLTFIGFLIIQRVFGWNLITDVTSFFIITGIFTLAYCGLWFGFFIYYKAENDLLNDKLNDYKKNKI